MKYLVVLLFLVSCASHHDEPVSQQSNEELQQHNREPRGSFVR